MSATITATGTWTPLNVNLTNMDKTDPNVPVSNMMQLEQLKYQDLPELTQFVQAMADGYGIGFWPARALLMAVFTAMINRETPAVSRLYAP